MEMGEARAGFPFLRTAAPDRRLLLFFWALGLSMLAALLGLLFDGVWHTVNPFETFWSPPHLMIYSGFGVGGTLLLYAVFHPWFRSREVFGPGIRVPFLNFPVPASLFWVGFGSFQAVLAGLLDSAWHANLGANETAWSYPHMLVVLGGVLMALGLMSGAQALRASLGERERPAWPVVMFGAGLLIIFAFPITPLISPAEDLQRQLANADFYRLNAQTLKIDRAFLDWGVHQGNPLLVPLLVPLALVGPLAMARALAPGKRLIATRAALANLAILVGAFGGFFYLLKSQPGLVDPSSPVTSPRFVGQAALGGLVGILTLALPQDLLPKPLKTALPGPLKLLSDRPGPAAAALAMATLHGLRFGFHPLGTLLAPFAGVGGAMIGEKVASVATEPTARRVGWTLLLLTLVLPAAFGAFDLYLRLWF